MNVLDLLPEEPISSNEFYRLLRQRGVDEVTIQDDQIHLWKLDFSPEFVDEVADSYLAQLLAHPSSDNLLSRFTRGEIRESLHRLLVCHRLELTFTIFDVFPQYLTGGDIEREVLGQAIFKFAIHSISPQGNLIYLEGSEPKDGFVDRLVDVYLGRLALSQSEVDRAWSARFSREEIRVNLHRLIRYTYNDSPGLLQLQSETTPVELPSFWEGLTNWWSGRK